MKRYRGLIVRLVLPIFVLLTVFWIGPWIQLHSLEGKLPPSPLLGARVGDWACYKVTRSGYKGLEAPFVRCYRIEAVEGDRVALVSTAAIGAVASLSLERTMTPRSKEEPWLLQIFPHLKRARWPDVDSQLEPRTELDRTFMCLKIGAKTVEAPPAQRVTYWLSEGVRCTGWVARSEITEHVSDLQEELRGFGREGTVEWGVPPENALVR
ncbi:MAG TPA: hypothetical protein VFF73_29600 [Planctomycetota bacterium]|nr:hypothetical protein [Planctomycetota bacterium]